jgi:ketosteroid isomerase-like protein
MDGATTTRADAMRATVLEYFRCLDMEDWDGMREVWHEDGNLRAVGARPRTDREAIVAYFSKLFTVWPKHEDQPTRLIVSEAQGTVVAEVTFVGTTLDGRDVSFDAVDVFDLEGTSIKRLSNWYDIEYARRVIAPPGT